MEIIVGKYSGFCNGVKNTIDKTINELNKNRIIYSIGEIVHNEMVVDNLVKKGLIVKNDIHEIPNNSRVIIRAHGEKIDVYRDAERKNIELIDLTCGRVKVIHNKILNQKDSYVIIIGKKKHPETIAHKSYSNTSFVIEDLSDVLDAYNDYLVSGKKKIYIVAQTTFNSNLFDSIVDEIKRVFLNTSIIIDKTICNATSIRQNEAMEIAQKVDKMIIIGGLSSSNTKELEVIAQKYCDKVYLIQTKDDLDKEKFNENDIVGITAGASTPKEIIDDVINYLESLYKKVK